MSAAFRSPAVFRIIGGKWRGRKIHFHSSSSLRSSGSRVRESLFNCLGQRLDNLNCLDLFAGGGALGLEAASRGAQTITFVEKNITTANAIRCTVNLLNAGNVQVRRADAFTFLSEAKEFF
jgi:16S rRNA (guanine966-N2)-methyltransferase